MTSNSKMVLWRRADFLFCALVAAVLYLRFFRLPFVPIDPAGGDQAVYLWSARKILSGQVIYSDFFQFSTPATDYLYAGLIQIFGNSAILPKFVTLIVGIAFAAVGIPLSRSVLSGWHVYLPSLLFLTAGFLPLPDATHHVFSTLAALVGLIVILPGISDKAASEWRPFAAGVFSGMSLCFTHTRGPLVAAAFVLIYFFARHDKRLWKRNGALVLLGCILTSALLLTPVFWKAGSVAVINCLIDFPLHHHRGSLWNSFGAYGIDLPIAGYYLPTTQSWHTFSGLFALARWLLIYIISPGIYVLSLFRLRRRGADRKGADRNRYQVVQAIAITGLALFMSIAYAPTHFRMGIISLPALILLIWWLEAQPSGVNRALVALLALFATFTFCAGILRSQSPRLAVLDTPSGKVAVSPGATEVEKEKFDWLMQHTRPGDPFFMPDYSSESYLFQLDSPGPLSQMWINGYSTPKQIQQTITAIEQKKVRYAFWPLDFQTANTTGETNQLAPLEKYLRDNFVLDHTFSDSDQVWKRKED